MKHQQKKQDLDLNHMIILLRGFLRTRSKSFLVVVAVTLVFTIGVADYLTGYHLSLGLFYVAPVALLAWYVSSEAGVSAASLSALTWYLVNSVFAPPEVGKLILVWNTVIRFGFFIMISSLLRSLKKAYEHQKEMAQTDPLTGLLNSRAFEDGATIELMRATRNNYDVAAIYLDLDNFKTINDLRGHDVGDSLLRDVGLALKANLRATDIVGRLGGDEFAVLLCGTSQFQLQETASRLQDAVLRITTRAVPPVTVTIGAVSSYGSENIKDLLRRADQAMYHGKRSSKGSICMALAEGDTLLR
jgi:diguanylate cyclase (GGDEF)-like protein